MSRGSAAGSGRTPTTRALGFLPAVSLAALLVALLPGRVTAQQAVPTEGAAPVYLELPRVEGLELPAGFDASRRAAGRALGIRSVEEMVRLSHTDRTVVEGNRPVLVLPALFEDSPGPPVSVDEMRRILFDGPADPGTLTEFYDELSGGRLDVTGEVAPWVSTRITLEEASGELNGHGWLGDSLQVYVKHAIELADEHVDFGQFDSDGPDGVPNSGDDDGLVDLLVINFPAVAGHCGGPGIWPHAGGLLSGDADTPPDERGPVPTDDLGPDGEPIRIDSYIAQSATDCGGQEVHTPAVVAHEIGHLLGVGDYYDVVDGIEPEGRRWLVGCFGLMSAGAWGCGSGEPPVRFGPTHMTPLTKAFLGWIEIEDVPSGDDMVYELAPSQTGGRALRVPLGPEASMESFLIEYRPRIGFDEALPASGVLIYHRDHFPGVPTVPSDRPDPSDFHLVEADGDYNLLRTGYYNGDRGSAEDVFAQDGSVDSLTVSTTPPTHDHQGNPSSVTIDAIEVTGDRARVQISYEPGFGAVRLDVATRISALQSIEGHFEITGGEPPFEVRLSDEFEAPEGLDISVEGREGHLGGRLLDVGFYYLRLIVEDATGLRDESDFAFRVTDLPIPRQQLIDAVLEPSASELDQDEVEYLDVSGHPNGELDIGDVRAALERRQLLEDPEAGPP